MNDTIAALDAIAGQRTAEARGAEPRVNQYLPDSPEAVGIALERLIPFYRKYLQENPRTHA